MSNSRRIGPHTPEESEGFSIYQNYTAAPLLKDCLELNSTRGRNNDKSSNVFLYIYYF